LIFRRKTATVEENPTKEVGPMLTLQLILFLLIALAVAVSIAYSIRFRREIEPIRKGIYNARLNISMGIMLIFIALSQLFFFNDSNLRRIFGTVCLLMGLFNLFAGIRNHGAYQRLLNQPKTNPKPKPDATPDQSLER
jgi:glucan phosphoethanolaminetransferase (alkaline phosphatase superfamily)